MYSSLFSNDEFLIDEKVQFLKFANEYKIYDKQGQQIGVIKQKLSNWHKILHLIMNKAMLPFTLEIQDINQKTLVTIKRGWTFWLSKIKILGPDENVIGFIKQKFAWLKPTFTILDAQNEQIGQITGDWKAWNFNITDKNGQEIGKINKKWAGALKEVFTSADKYYVTIDPAYAEDINKINILSTAITIDMVLKESK